MEKNECLVIYKWRDLFYKVNIEDNFQFQNFKNVITQKEEVNFILPFFELPNLMYTLSKDDRYAPSLSSLSSFMNKALNYDNNEYFNAFFLFLINGKLIAYLNVTISFDLSEIDYIYICKENRKKGISSFLLNIYFNQLTLSNPWVIKRVLLEVGINNIEAIQLYKKLSFKKIATRKNYYKNNEDALIMEKLF